MININKLLQSYHYDKKVPKITNNYPKLIICVLFGATLKCYVIVNFIILGC